MKSKEAQHSRRLCKKLELCMSLVVPSYDDGTCCASSSFHEYFHVLLQDYLDLEVLPIGLVKLVSLNCVYPFRGRTNDVHKGF